MSAQSNAKAELIQSIKYLACTLKIIQKFFELLRPFFKRKKKKKKRPQLINLAFPERLI